MRPCQAAPAFDTTMSTPPKVSTILANAALTEAASVTSQAMPIAPPIALAFSFAAALVHVEQRDFGARRGECLRGRGADRAARAGHRHDLSGERLFGRAAELGLLERPVFHVEQMRVVERLVAPGRFGIRDGLDRGLGEIGGDARVLLRAAEPEQAEPRHQHDARHRIEALLDAAAARVVGGEIGAVFADEIFHRRGDVGLEIRELAAVRRRHDQRPVLRADRVVRRHHAGLAVARDLRAVDEIEHRIAAAEFEDEALPRAFGLLVLQAAGAAHDRRDVGERGAIAAAVARWRTLLSGRAAAAPRRASPSRSCAHRLRARRRRR